MVDAQPADGPPTWYLSHLEVYVRNALEVSQALPEHADRLPQRTRELLARVTEHPAWCQRELAREAEEAGPGGGPQTGPRAGRWG
jgi:hypothetical protein